MNNDSPLEREFERCGYTPSGNPRRVDLGIGRYYNADPILSHPLLKASTYDEGKAPLAQLPWAALEAVARVQAYGHSKYKDFNNYRKGMEVMRNLSCVLRHVKAYVEGQDLDPESKEPHLAHAACRLAFVLQNIADGTAIDDRYKK